MELTVTVVDAMAEPPVPIHVSVYELVLLGVILKVPLVASLPLHAPLAVHDVAFVEDQFKVALPPEAMLDGFAESLTVGAAVSAIANATVLLTEPPPPVQDSVKL
jgi:hypothetical protein